ncbi:hypothetical protein GCM10009626_16720 [Brachybacterium sacelli]
MGSFIGVFDVLEWKEHAGTDAGDFVGIAAGVIRGMEGIVVGDELDSSSTPGRSRPGGGDQSAPSPSSQRPPGGAASTSASSPGPSPTASTAASSAGSGAGGEVPGVASWPVLAQAPLTAQRACQMVCVSRTERNGKNHDHDR